jgi:hypothetical protein
VAGGRGAAVAEGRRAPAVGWLDSVLVAVVVAAAVVVAGLGMLADLARQVGVPSTSGVVRVREGESLWQVARRVAPSADPGAVAARIVELNNLSAPAVHPGQALLSPVG